MKTTFSQVGWQFIALLGVASANVAEGQSFKAVDHTRKTIYHSPQKPGFTSWVGAWIMPDGDLLTCFTQATGPISGRPRAPQDVREKLNWPPKGAPDYDMTGLDLKNVHLRSSDSGKTWKQVSADPFKSCMNGVTGEAETALADGTIFVFGHVGGDDAYGKADQSIVMDRFKLAGQSAGESR